MRNLSCILILILLVGCVENYTPKGIGEIGDLLVIEGKITDNISTFYLKRSVKLTIEMTGREVVYNAKVYVEKDNGERISGQYVSNGIYNVPTGALDSETKYRLYVEIGNEAYQSEFLSPFFTPEIDGILPVKRREGEPVYICVNTHDAKDQSRYYLWSYKEVWEVKTELETQEKDTYYCWGRDSSNIMILGSSEKVSENVIYQKRINEIPSDNDRISVLYYIMVEQNQIRKEAYDYYSNIQKNIEQTGSIFSPVPSEMKGNIRCITNLETPVIGFIDVSTTVSKDVFINDEDWGLYEAPDKHCWGEISNVSMPEYTLYYQSSNGDLYAPDRCVDCRKKEKVTKNRPDFWPNDHY